jgi:hypothetical protein
MIRRVMIVPLSPQCGYPLAFRGIWGAENVGEFDYLDLNRQSFPLHEINRLFIEKAKAFAPDWIFTQLQETNIIKPATITEIRSFLPKTVISTWTGDIRAQVPPYLASVCPAVHVVFISSLGHIPIYKAAGAAVCEYLQIGLDWNEDVLFKPDWSPPFRVPDVVFIGNNYGAAFPEGTAERENAAWALRSAGVDVGIVGGGWPTRFSPVGSCHIKHSPQVYRRAKVALSVNHFNHVEGYWSDRHLMAMASGTPLVSKYIPGLEKEFENGKDLFWFNTHQEMVDQVKMLLAHEDLRRKVGRAGREKMLQGHTWYHRILGALPTIERVREGL